MKYIVALSAVLALIFSSCKFNNDFSNITSAKPIFGYYNFDTTRLYQIPEFTSKWEPGDSITGKYNFIVLPGYHGYHLELKPDSTFTEIVWTDIQGFKRESRGKWMHSNNKIFLRDRLGRKYELFYYRNSWTMFLIPTAKAKLFQIQLDKNGTRLENLGKRAGDLRMNALEDSMSYLRELCFYRLPKKAG